MYNLILKNKQNTFAEILTDVDYGSFRYDYEKNNERSISFTIYKTNDNADIFENITNENYIIWNEQYYTIKNTSIKYDGNIILNEVTAKHIFMEFQDWYIEKNIENEETNSENDDSEQVQPTYTLNQYLDFGFEGNNLGFSYNIKGTFNQRVAVEDLGNKNGMEYLSEGAELFGYIYYADNKNITIYDEASFYELSDEPFIYQYNTDEVQASVSTLDLKTYIKGYGKKKTKTETKNYNPVKPPELVYDGTFFKEGTWRTQQVGASYSYNFNCKWGNETLEWSLKKLSRGGMLDLFLDGNLIGTYSCYSHTARSEKIVVARNLSKGNHTIKTVFKGPDSNVKEYKTAPVMYVGTEKSTILNLTAVLKGTDVYHVYDDYTSPNSKIFGIKQAPTLFDDNALDKTELRQKMLEQLNDQPTVELSTNYMGYEEIKDNNKIRFVHKPLGFNTELKVVKISASHPYTYTPVSVEFSNAARDIIQIQNQINRNIKKVNNLVKNGSSSTAVFSVPKNYSDIVGVTLLDE